MIGHASKDERGRASGGQAGDQTGGEVCIRAWYNAGWNRVLRPKNRDTAEKMACFVETVCRGNMVGYDQGQRNTLREYARAAGWDGSKIKDRCETDCSAFMAVAAEAAGIKIPYTGGWNAPVTQNMCGIFGGTGAFEVLKDQKYLISDKYLRRGDILVRESGHTAMNLTDGIFSGAASGETQGGASNSPEGAQTPAAKTVRATEYAHYFDKTLAGTYTVTASALNLRNGAGTAKKILTSLPRGTRVKNYGYYNVFGGEKWLYILARQGSAEYTAFACGKYLEKEGGQE